MTQESPLLTDHAVIRYAERVMGIPIRSMVTERIFSNPGRANMVRKLGRGRLRLGPSDVILVVEGARVATVIVSKPDPAAPSRLEHT